jgi:iron(III) transport system ATP-binding protein
VRQHTLDFVRETGITTVIVTHDPDEAMRIADRIALLEAGRLVQYGSPEELYRNPSTLFTARFFSDVAALTGTCRGGLVETSLGSFPAPPYAAGTEAIACIRPHHLRVAMEPTGITARVLSSEFCGEGRRIVVKVDGLETPVAVHAFSGPHARVQHSVKPGMTIHLEIQRDDVPVVAISPLHKESSHAQHSSP